MVVAAAYLAAGGPEAGRGAGLNRVDDLGGPRDGDPGAFVPPSSWHEQRNSASPTRYSAGRLDSGPGGRPTGRISHIRFDLRRFEAQPGKWVREFAIPLDVVSRDGTISGKDRRARVDEIQRYLDDHVNQHHRFDNGDQAHFVIEAKTPGEVRPGWDVDSSRGVAVDMFDSAAGGHRAGSQLEWDVRAKPESLLPHVLQFVGGGERPHGVGSPDVVGRGSSNAGITSADVAAIDRTSQDAGPVFDHALGDGAGDRSPVVNPAEGMPKTVTSDGPVTANTPPPRPPRGPTPPTPSDRGPAPRPQRRGVTLGPRDTITPVREEIELSNLNRNGERSGTNRPVTNTPPPPANTTTTDPANTPPPDGNPPNGTPPPDGNPPDGNPRNIGDQVPPYLKDSLAGGPSKQPKPATGLDIETGLTNLHEELRGNAEIKRIQQQVNDNVLSYLGKGLSETIMVGKRRMELNVRTKLDFDNATKLEAKPEPGKAKPASKNSAKTDFKADSSRDHDANLGPRVNALPPIVVQANLQASLAPNTKHESKTTFDTTQKSEVEIGELTPVTVPVDVTYTLTDAKGSSIEGGSTHGDVGLEVPTNLTKPGSDDTTVLTQAPPSRFAVEEAVPVGGHDFFARAATGLSSHLTELGATGRSTLQNFLGNSNIKSNLPKMAVFNPHADEGWVRSDALVKGPDSSAWTNKGSQFEMRAVAREFQVLDKVADVKHTDTASAKTGVTDKTTTKRTIGGDVHVGAGADMGALTFAVGPTVGGSHSREKATESSLGANAKDTLTTTGDATRYRVIYDLQARKLGDPTVINLGQLDATQWTRQDRADGAGLKESAPDTTTDGTNPTNDGTNPGDNSTNPTDNTTNPADDTTNPADDTAAPQTPPREVYAPPHIEALKSVGGSMIDDFHSGDHLRRTISTALQNVPGHKWYHFSSKKFMRPFDSSEFANGLTSRVNDILARGQNLADHLTDPQLAALVDTMLSPDGLTFEVVKKGAFWNYHTTVSLKAQLSNLHDQAPLTVKETTATSKLKDKSGTSFKAGKDTTGSGGVQARVIGPGMGKGTGIWVGEASYSRTGSSDGGIGSTNQESTANTHGDHVKEDGKLGERKVRPFGADLTITPHLESYVQPNNTTRRVTFGSWGRSTPDLVYPSPLPAATPPASHTVPLRLMVPESMVTKAPPNALDVTPQNAREIDSPRPVKDMGPGASRTFDNAEIVSVMGTEHIVDSMRRQLERASDGDPIFRSGHTGGSQGPRLFTNEINSRYSPDRLRNDPRLFSRPQTTTLHWDRRRADVDAEGGVRLTPVNPRPLSAEEFRTIKKTMGSTTTTSGGKGTSNTVAQKNVLLAATPTKAASYPSVLANMANLVGLTVNPFSMRWGNKHSVESEGIQKTTYEDGKPVKKTLVMVGIDAHVVGETKKTGNFDKFGVLPDEGSRTAGEQFRLNDSVIMWATDKQMAEMENRPLPEPEPAAAHPENQTLPPPDSLVRGQKPSIGLGTVTSLVDLSDRIPSLHKQLGDNMKSPEVADRLLPKSRFDIEHDNYGTVTDFLSNANRSVNTSLNGGEIAPLRLEDKLSGKTYYLTVDSHFVDSPSFKGIEHADSLKTEETANFSTNSEHSRGRTAATVGASYRPGFRLVDQQEPGTNPSHKPAGGIMQGGEVSGDFGKRDVKNSESDKLGYKQSASTSGPLGAYQAKLGFDIKIERDISVGPDGRETAGEVVAHDSGATRDVDIIKVDESFPQPSIGNTFGVAGDMVTVDPKQAGMNDWHADAGKTPLPPAGTFEAEHYFGDLADLRAAAEDALTASGVKVDTKTVAALKSAITLPKIKAALPAMDDGKFVVSLPHLGREIEIHTRLTGQPRLASVSANVKVEGTQSVAHENKVELKTGNEYKATINAPLANVGGAPAEGHKGNFAAISGGFAYGRPMLGKENVLSAEGGPPKKESKTPLTSDVVKTDDEVTQVNLHDVDFRFVARPMSGKIGAKTGITDLHVHDGYAIRGNPDSAHPLPQSLIDAAKNQKELGKTWGDALKSADGLNHNRPHPPMSLDAIQEANQARDNARTAADTAESAWWSGREQLNNELETARRQWTIDHLPEDMRRQREVDERARDLEQRERERRADERDLAATNARDEQARRDRAAQDRADAEERAAQERAEEQERAAQERAEAERRAARERAEEQERAEARERAEAQKRAEAQERAAKERAEAERRARRDAQERAARDQARRDRAEQARTADEERARAEETERRESERQQREDRARDEQETTDPETQREGTDRDGTDQRKSDSEGVDPEGSKQEESKQGETSRDGTNQDETGREETEQDGTGREGTELEGTGRDGTDQRRSDSEGVKPEGSKQEETKQGETSRDGTEQNGTEQNGTEQRETDSEGVKPDESRQEESGRDETGREGTEQDGTGREGSEQQRSAQDQAAREQAEKAAQEQARLDRAEWAERARRAAGEQARAGEADRQPAQAQREAEDRARVEQAQREADAHARAEEAARVRQERADWTRRWVEQQAGSPQRAASDTQPDVVAGTRSDVGSTSGHGLDGDAVPAPGTQPGGPASSRGGDGESRGGNERHDGGARRGQVEPARHDQQRAPATENRPATEVTENRPVTETTENRSDDGSVRDGVSSDESFVTADEGAESFVTAPEGHDPGVTLGNSNSRGTVDDPVPLSDLVDGPLDLSDVHFVPLEDGAGNTVGVGFPRADEGGVLQDAFRHGAGRKGAYTTVMHHDAGGFAVTRKSDGAEVRLDENGLLRLLTSAKLPGGQDWRQASELVMLSCRVADPKLGDRLGAVERLLRQHDYHGDVRGPDRPVTVFEDGHVEVQDGGSLRTAVGDKPPVLPEIRSEAGTFVEELMDDIDSRVPPEPPKLAERFGDWALSQTHSAAPVDSHALETEHGMSQVNQRRFQAMADRFGVVVDVRPTNPASVAWIEQGAMPKPMAIKAKTVNELDVHLGMPAEKIGLVGFFEPVAPDPASLPDGIREQVLGRHAARSREFRELGPEMRSLEERGEFRVRDGLVEGRAGNEFRNITGDHDVFDIRLPDDGAALHAADYDNVVWLLQNRNMGVQHGAHMYWTPKGDFQQKIFDDIVGRHQSDEPLIRFAPGEPPSLMRLVDDHSARPIAVPAPDTASPRPADHAPLTRVDSVHDGETARPEGDVAHDQPVHPMPVEHGRGVTFAPTPSLGTAPRPNLTTAYRVEPHGSTPFESVPPMLHDQPRDGFPAFGRASDGVVTDTHPELRVAADNTLAINGTRSTSGTTPANEAREFFATPEIVDAARETLRRNGSSVGLEVAESRIVVGKDGAEQVLHRVVPSMPRTFSDICRDFAETVHGGRPDALVFRDEHGDTAAIGVNTGNSVEVTGAFHLAEGLAEAVEQGRAGDLTPSRAADFAARDERRFGGEPGGALPGPRYGTKFNLSSPRATQSAMDSASRGAGVNQHAWARPGEMYVRNSVPGKGSDGTPDYTVNGARDGDAGQAGYHFATVIAESTDGRTQITLENYNHASGTKRAVEEAIAGNLERHGGKFGEIAANLAGDTAETARHRELAEALAAIEHTGYDGAAPAAKQRVHDAMAAELTAIPAHQQWHFKMYTREPGESFFEQQALLHDPSARVRGVNPLVAVAVGGSNTISPRDVSFGPGQRTAGDTQHSTSTDAIARKVARAAVLRSGLGLPLPTVTIAAAGDPPRLGARQDGSLARDRATHVRDQFRKVLTKELTRLQGDTHAVRSEDIRVDATPEGGHRPGHATVTTHFPDTRDTPEGHAVTDYDRATHGLGELAVPMADVRSRAAEFGDLAAGGALEHHRLPAGTHELLTSINDALAQRGDRALSARVRGFVTDALLATSLVPTRGDHLQPGKHAEGGVPVDRHAIQLVSPARLTQLLNEVQKYLTRNENPFTAPHSLLTGFTIPAGAELPVRLANLGLLNLSAPARAAVADSELFTALRDNPRALLNSMYSSSGHEKQYFLNTCVAAAVNAGLRSRVPSLASMLHLGRSLADAAESALEATTQKDKAHPDRIFGRTQEEMVKERVAEARTEFDAIEARALKLAGDQRPDTEVREEWRELDERVAESMQKLSEQREWHGLDERVARSMQKLSAADLTSGKAPVLTKKSIDDSWAGSAAMAVPKIVDRPGRRFTGIDPDSYLRRLWPQLAREPDSSFFGSADHFTDPSLGVALGDHLGTPHERKAFWEQVAANTGNAVSLPHHEVFVQAATDGERPVFILNDPRHPQPTRLTPEEFATWAAKNDAQASASLFPHLADDTAGPAGTHAEADNAPLPASPDGAPESTRAATEPAAPRPELARPTGNRELLVEQEHDNGLTPEHAEAVSANARYLAEHAITRSARGYAAPVVTVSARPGSALAETMADALTSGIGAHASKLRGVPTTAADLGLTPRVERAEHLGERQAELAVDWELRGGGRQTLGDIGPERTVEPQVITTERRPMPHPILDDRTWAHSTADAPWAHDPNPATGAEVAAARAGATTTTVRGQDEGVIGGRIERRPDGSTAISLDRWRHPIAYDHSRFQTSDGKWTQEYTVRLNFVAPRGTDIAATVARAQAAVDRFYNRPGYRLPSGDSLHVRVELDTSAAAHATVEIGPAGSGSDQLTWAADAHDVVLAHEIGHFLGAYDENARTGADGTPWALDSSRVVRDDGLFTDAVREYMDKVRENGTDEGLAEPTVKPRNLWLLENRNHDLGGANGHQVRAPERPGPVPDDDVVFPALVDLSSAADQESGATVFGTGGPRPKPSFVDDLPDGARARADHLLGLDMTREGDKPVVLERDLPSRERRFTWAGHDRPHLPPLPELLELPRLVHSVWLGGALRAAGAMARFRENLERTAHAAGDRWKVVLWTDISRDKLLAALHKLVPHRVPTFPVKHGLEIDDDWDDLDLDDVAGMYEWLSSANIALVNVDEVFNEDSPMDLHEHFAGETAKHSRQGYDHAAEIAANEILSRFGGVALDPGHYARDLSGAENVVRSGPGWARANGVTAMAQGHPAADLYRDALRQRYEAPVPAPVPAMAGASAGPLGAPDVPADLAGVLESLPALDGFVPGDPAMEEPLVRPLADLSVEDLSKRVIDVLVHELSAHPGNLNLAAVADLVAGHPRAGEVWTVVLAFLATRPELADQIRTVTMGTVDEAGLPHTAVLPPRAAEMVTFAQDGTATLNWPDWL